MPRGQKPYVPAARKVAMKVRAAANKKAREDKKNAGAVARGNRSSEYEAKSMPPGSTMAKLRPGSEMPPVDISPRSERADQDHVKKKACGGKMKKMYSGGMVCRGMGAATRGGNYKG